LMGATTGRIVGEISAALGQGAAHPGVYAAIGAASFLGGFTRTTAGIAATIAEITGDVALIAPAMAAITVASAVAGVIQPSSYLHEVVEVKRGEQ